MKKTPFHEIGLKYGAKMVELFGYYLPWEYSVGHQGEHLGTRKAVSLCDLHYMAVFRISGSRAIEFVQTLITNDCSNKREGSIQYTAMCNTDGHMVDDCTVWRRGPSEFMIVSGAEEDYNWIAQHTKKFGVQVLNVTESHTTLALQGPKSPDVLRKLTDLDLGRLKYYQFTKGRVAGLDCLVARMGYTGEFGYEIHFDAQHGAEMWEALMRAGREERIVPCGQAALESLRQEAGYLLVGKDHDRNTNPFEAGIGFAVKLSKPGFIGRDALEKIATDGVRRRMVWLDIDSEKVLNTGDTIQVGSKIIGQVTSGSFSPTRARGTAMGYVNPGHAIPGLSVGVQSGGTPFSATLSVMPLYDPGDTRSRGHVPE